MSTAAVTGLELPDGYSVIERIGSGGYGEVWRATAPGGVEKAVKVVYGHCDEELAERELKSLERIREVRHPFVISLERFDVVAGRLTIVTELADMSLDAAFRQSQAEGAPGIPRDRLLRYLRDAADALDCLVERHSLQHLDIKPENLLVVGDHVKIGDFGLVKELATRTLNSMMGGMTPLYSAPEVFDDAPSSRSDQYSLAIVYQQMLTGQLPFPGRTPAQLAKQHTQAEPNLQPLPPADREVMKRALAKRPEARFDSCTAFVEALIAGDAARKSSASDHHQIGHESSPDDTKSIASINTQSKPAGAAPAQAAAHAHGQPAAVPKTEAAKLVYPEVDSTVVDRMLPEFDSTSTELVPTLLVAVGGIGMTMMNFTRRWISDNAADHLDGSHLGWLAIDTDRETLGNAINEPGTHALPSIDTLHIPLKRPKQYRDQSQDLLRWVSRRWLYNIPRSLETRGYRPLGRIAAVDHAEEILKSLYMRMQPLGTCDGEPGKLRVVVLAGTSGGTGSAIAGDIAQAARSIARDLSIEMEVRAVLALPQRAAGTADSLAVANSYSLLTEVSHLQQNGNAGEAPPKGPALRFESDSPAFDDVYLLSVPPRTAGDERIEAYWSIGRYLGFEATTAAGNLLQACRRESTTDCFRFRSFRTHHPSTEQTPSQQLEQASVDVLSCGHERFTLGFTVEESLDESALRIERPELGTIAVDANATTLVTEAGGIDPLAVAARLAEHYPDVADAASRLHAREDIAWNDLRDVADD